MASELTKKDRKQVSHELIQFADRLAPSAEFDKDGTEKVQNVMETFKRTKAYSIDRVYYGGSVGKNTSVIFPDFDCVMLLNNKEPPLEAELKRFEAFLKDKYKELDIDLDSIHQKTVTVTFEFNNGIEVDLLAGCNFSPKPEEQRRIVLEKMRNLVDKRSCYFYSTSLAETQLDFLKTRSGFCHQLIRLAKYWFKSLSLGASVFGGSAMMEMICAAVVEREPNLDNMIDAFKSFLELIRVIGRLQIAFYKHEKGNWQLLDLEDFKLQKYKSYYDPAILARDYFVMEPSSPYNDLAQSLNGPVISKLGRFAEAMLERVTGLEAPESNRFKTLSPVTPPQIHFDQFFQPFPMRLRDAYPYSGIPTFLLINHKYSSYNSPNCKTDENKVNFFKGNSEAGKVTQTISNNILFLIRARAKKLNGTDAYTLGLANISFDDAKDAVEAITNENFGVSKYIEKSDDEKRHKTYDVTLYIPYRCNAKVYAVQLSLKWSA